MRTPAGADCYALALRAILSVDQACRPDDITMTETQPGPEHPGKVPHSLTATAYHEAGHAVMIAKELLQKETVSGRAVRHLFREAARE